MKTRPKGLDTPNDAASFLSVSGKSSKKSMAHRGEMTRSAMLFFEALPSRGFLVCLGLKGDTPNDAPSFFVGKL